MVQTQDGAGIVTPRPVHLLLDYAGRGDAQPVYIGRARLGALPTQQVWEVTRLGYESTTANARVVEQDVRLSLAWANRADPTVNGQPAWTF